MENTYRTALLFENDGASSSFASISFSLQPGQPFQPSDSDSILISGGFPQVSPETPFPLSPTLQLNGDLTSLDETALTELALAELKRVNSVSFRSYTVEVEKRVAVLAGDVARLQQFIETYESVLELDPLLLKDVDPDYPTITELEINGRGPHHISYTVRSPIIKDRCTYCGKCSNSCPEDCLSEYLFVDFNKCSFCKECEKACPLQAIDIYGLEECTLEVPSIVVLKGTNFEIPEGRTSIFKEEQLPVLFKNLVPYQIDEVVTHSSGLCQASSRQGCNLCLANCPFGAINKNDGSIAIDPHECRECGNCIAVCPSGAMQYARFDDAAFIEYLGSIPLAKGAGVILGSEESLHRFWWKQRGKKHESLFFMEYPKIEALSLFHFLMLFAKGAGHIVLFEEADTSAEIRKQVEMTNTILRTLFSLENYVVFAGGSFSPNSLATNQYPPFEGEYTDFTFTDRRRKLASVLNYLICKSGKTIELQAGELQGFANIVCDTDSCTQCLACLNECKIKALASDEENLALTYTAGHCIGCGVCVDICPENALGFASEFTMDAHFFQRKVLAQAEPATCKACGKVYGTKKSLERVMQLLANHSHVGDSYFEYCADCKVARMFEKEEI